MLAADALSWHSVLTVGLLSFSVCSSVHYYSTAQIICFERYRRHHRMLAWLIHISCQDIPIPEFTTDRQENPTSCAQILLNPVSRQDILRLPAFRTMFWQIPGARKYPLRHCEKYMYHDLCHVFHVNIRISTNGGSNASSRKKSVLQDYLDLKGLPEGPWWSSVCFEFQSMSIPCHLQQQMPGNSFDV